jgi:hypothetical protein
MLPIGALPHPLFPKETKKRSLEEEPSCFVFDRPIEFKAGILTSKKAQPKPKSKPLQKKQISPIPRNLASNNLSELDLTNLFHRMLQLSSENPSAPELDPDAVSF